MAYTNQMGDLGLQPGITGSIESFAASTVAKFATTSAISTFAPAAFGAYAGPIGAVVGGIVSLLMMLFGAKPKMPWYGVTVVVPQGKKPTFGRVLGYMNKPAFDFLESVDIGTRDPTVHAQAWRHILSELAGPPEDGAIVIEAGGLPGIVQQVKQTDWSQVTAHLMKVAKPYIAILSGITNDSVRQKLLDTDLGFGQSQGYKFNLDIRLKQYAAKDPAAQEVMNKYDEYVVGHHTTSQKAAFTQGFNSIIGKMNKAVSDVVGIDAQTGNITNNQLATTAFATTTTTGGATVPATSGGGIVSSNFFPLLLVAGLVFLSSRGRTA